MKKIILFITLLNVCAVCAANAQVATASKQYHDDTRLSGSFYYNVNTKKAEEHINVNYTAYPLPFQSILNLKLSTPNPLDMHVNIVNRAGVVVKRWKAQSPNYMYSTSFDILSLPPGYYHIDIYAGNSIKKTYSVSFEKI